MPHPWESPRAFDLAAGAGRIAARFPELAGMPVAYLGEGWDKWALLVDDRWVFRLPKHEDSDGDALVEIPLLRGIRVRMPVAIPEVAFDAGTWFGYAYLPGRPLADFEWDASLARRLAPRLGAFLSALHATPAASLAVPEGARNMERLQARVMPWLGDPATDFAGMAVWGGEAFARQVLEHYALPVDAGLLNRATYQALCVAVMDAYYGIEASKPGSLRSAEQALRRLLP